MTELREQGSHQWIYICTLSWVLLFSCAPSIHTFSNSRSNLLRQLGGKKPHYHYWHSEKSNCSTSSCCSRKCACKGQKNVACCVLLGYFLQGVVPAHRWPCIPAVDTLPLWQSFSAVHVNKNSSEFFHFCIPSLQVFTHLVFSGGAA